MDIVSKERREEELPRQEKGKSEVKEEEENAKDNKIVR